MWDYGSLDRLADLAEQRGLDTLGLFGWAHGGHDRYYPDYIPDPTMGGPETLKESIRKVQQRGQRVILYANGQLIDSATEFYRLARRGDDGRRSTRQRRQSRCTTSSRPRRRPSL